MPNGTHPEAMGIRQMKRLLIAMAVLSLVASSVAAQVLADNGQGQVRVAGNELLVESKVNDPAAVRVAAPETQNGVGKISFDALVGSSRDEIVLLQGKQTTYGHRPGGLFWAGIKKPDFGVGDDQAMFNWLEVSYRDGVRFHLPIYAPNLAGGSAPRSFLAAGRFELHLQDSDGNFVLYERLEEAYCPRWAITWLPYNGTGYVDRAVLDPPCN
jgi:hypothetical protein